MKKFVGFDLRYKKSQYGYFQYRRHETIIESTFQVVDGLITVFTIGIVDTHLAFAYNDYLMMKKQAIYKAAKGKETD
jgi:hypothetical protein